MLDVQYAFHLKTEVAHKRDGGTLVLEKLCLAFDELAEAEKWRKAIAQQVKHIRRLEVLKPMLEGSLRKL